MKQRLITLLLYILISLATPAMYHGAQIIKAETIKLLVISYQIKAKLPLMHMTGIR